MVETTASREQEGKSRSITDLLLWLALLPFIFGTLFCFGQLALLVGPRYSAVDTRSLISASYLPWPYDLIPAINLAALIEDIERDERAMGNPVEPEVVVQGTFWVPPTPTSDGITQTTETPVIFPTWTVTQTAEPPASRTQTPTTGATTKTTPTRMPSFTPLPSATPTRTPTKTTVFIPAPTNTEPPPPPPPPPTRTSTPKATATATQPPPTPTFTLTNTPVPTEPDTPTPVPPEPPTPIPAPTYAPVFPIAENGGVSEPSSGGCRAYFGYWNQNPQPVSIPLGPMNYLTVEVETWPPTHFEVGQISGAFSVEWNSKGDIAWSLDGRTAVAQWCNPSAMNGQQMGYMHLDLNPPFRHQNGQATDP